MEQKELMKQMKEKDTKLGTPFPNSAKEYN
jgi:hypothetical protein